VNRRYGIWKEYLYRSVVSTGAVTLDVTIIVLINLKVHEKFDMEYKNLANLLCQMDKYL